MAVTPTTIENLTTVVVSAVNAATTILTPSPQEVGRWRIRVVRAVWTAATAAGNAITITGVTKTAAGVDEIQTIWTSATTGTSTYIDQTSFPDECEFRGLIKVQSTGAATAATLYLHHG